MPDEESDHDCVKETELDLPVCKIHPVDHARDEGDGYAKEGDQDQSKADIIDLIAPISTCRQFWYVHPILFHACSDLNWRVKIK